MMGAKDPTISTGAAAWLVIAAIALAGLVVGFAAGWVLRGDGGPATVLPAAASEPTERPAATTATADPTTTAEAPIARDQLALAVLNGSGRAGLASETAAALRSAHYDAIDVGNAPARDGPTTVFFVVDRAREAARLARDLSLDSEPEPLPDGPIRDLVSPATELVVVLGSE